MKRMVVFISLALLFAQCEKEDAHYGVIRGIISSIDGVLAQATVEVLRGGTVIMTSTTDNDGAYKFRLAPGVYEVKAYKKGYKTSTQTITLKVDEDVVVNMKARAEIKISGVITDEYTHYPLSYISVSLVSLDKSQVIAHTTTNSQGAFAFGSIPDGNYYFYLYNNREEKYVPVVIQGESQFSLNLRSNYNTLSEEEISDYFSDWLESSLKSYCNVTNNYSDYFYIDELTLNDKMIATGRDYSYGNYTNQFFVAYTHISNEVTLNLGSTIGGNVQQASIWIDLNNDGDFNDTGEKLASQNNLNTPGIEHLSFQLPDDQSITYTTLRIAVDYYNSPAIHPCNNLDYGEFEDYGILIL